MTILSLNGCKEKNRDLTLQSDDSETYPCGGGLGVIRFTPYENWVLRSGCDWIILSKTNGQGNGSSLSVSYDILENSSYDSRESYISVSSNGIIKTIKIHQNPTSFLQSENPSYNCGWEGGLLDIKLYSNIEYDVKCECEWINILDVKGVREGKIQLNLDRNEEYTSRKATIRISNSNGYTSSISITQDGKPNFLTVSQYGIYNSSESLFTHAETLTQYGMVEDKTSLEFHIADPYTKKYLLIRELHISIKEMSTGDSFMATVEHNTSAIEDRTFDIYAEILKTDGKRIWAWDKDKKLGIIICTERI